MNSVRAASTRTTITYYFPKYGTPWLTCERRLGRTMINAIRTACSQQFCFNTTVETPKTCPTTESCIFISCLRCIKWIKAPRAAKHVFISSTLKVRADSHQNIIECLNVSGPSFQIREGRLNIFLWSEFHDGLFFLFLKKKLLKAFPPYLQSHKTVITLKCDKFISH